MHSLAQLRNTTLLIAVMLICTGCGRGLTTIDNPIAIDAGEYDAIYDASIEVLRENNFTVDRRDYRFGQITSEPLLAASAMEPWYGDNTTAMQVAESTMNHQRRLVRVNIEPIDVDIEDEPSANTAETTETTEDIDAEANGEMPSDIAPGFTPDYLLRVEVMIERYQRPHAQISSAVVARLSTGASLAEQSIRTEQGEVDAFWRPLERDVYLERRLVEQILERARIIATRSAQPTAPDDDSTAND